LEILEKLNVKPGRKSNSKSSGSQNKIEQNQEDDLPLVLLIVKSTK